MYIQPNSQIKLLKNVPLDATYNHTILFTNATAQSSYFISCAKYSLDQQSYQRVNKGTMNVQVNAENLYDCNYLMFQNTSFGQKWFYAFITGVEYVNTVTAQVSFMIDPMQTYLFDVELKQCFVEREHSSTDVAGDNVVEEPVNVGDIVCRSIKTYDELAGYPIFSDLGENQASYVAIVTHAGFSDQDIAGGVVTGLFTGLDYSVYQLDSAQHITDFKNLLHQFSVDNKNDSIVGITMMPKALYYLGSSIENMASVELAKPTSIGSYTPRNKKLLTYPYNYLVVDCGNDSGVYRYEWFKAINNNNCVLTLRATTCSNPQITLIPYGYNGVPAGYANYNEQLIMENFPQIPYTIDSYRAYLAQSTIGTTTRGLQNVFDGNNRGMGAVQRRAQQTKELNQPGLHFSMPSIGDTLLKLVAGATSIGNDIMNLMSGDVSGVFGDFRKGVNASKYPNQAKGSATPNIDVALKSKNFYFRNMTVSDSYMRIIDEFFDMYGYATMRIKVPNRSVRPHWNYVKTNGCVVLGNAPADDVQAICKIYDNGITFWKNASEVGNYSLNNSLS